MNRQVICASIKKAAVVAVSVFLIGVSAPREASAQFGNAIDPDTGLVCVTLICDFVRAPRNNQCICKKVWPNNDRRQRVQLQCSKKEGGRWVPCEN